MTQADRIHDFVIDRYIAPARAEGRSEITVRAGDVHQAMGLANAMPAICSAIGSNKFQALARATLVKWIGPGNGANVYFHFRLTAGPLPQQPVSPQQLVFGPSAFPIIDQDRFRRHPKFRKPQDLNRMLYSKASEDWVTCTVFGLLARYAPATWWFDLIKLPGRTMLNLFYPPAGTKYRRFGSGIACRPHGGTKSPAVIECDNQTTKLG
jgi:hypothetical protein